MNKEEYRKQWGNEKEKVIKIATEDEYRSKYEREKLDKKTAKEYTRSKKVNRNRMTHTGSTKTKLKPDYASTVGMSSPGIFGDPWKSSPFIPNPGGMFTHTGKMMKDFASGLRQVVGSNDNEFSKKVQADADIYGKYDHPLWGQALGAMVMMLPELAASPMALPLTALPFATMTKPFSGIKGIKGLAKEIASEASDKSRMIFPPGVRGGVEGATYGTLSHVNPESETPGRDRIKAGIAGAGTGLLLDGMISNAKLSIGKKQANRKRSELSGDLPVKVRMPGPELWNKRSMAGSAKNYRNSQTDASWDPGQRTKRLYESGYGKALEDIEDNANILRFDMTGKPTPSAKGESIRDLVKELQVGKDQSKIIAYKKMDDFLYDKNKTLTMDAREFYDIAEEFEKHIKLRVPGKKGQRIKQLEDSIESMYEKINGGFIDAKEVELFRRDIRNIINDTNLGSTGGNSANKLHSMIRSKMDSLELGKNVFGDKKSFDSFIVARDSNNVYNNKYNSNLIIKEASSGELSANQLSDKLFGAKNMQDSGDRLGALDTILGISPKYKKDLKRESLQQLLSGQSTKGRNFNIDEFITEYGGGLDTGRGIPIFKKLFDSKELGQLNDLYNVSRTLEQKQLPIKSKGYSKTSPQAQVLNLNTTPTGSTIADLPVIRKHIGKPVEDYLNAIRYGSGRKQATSNSLIGGKVGGQVGASMTKETTEEMKNPSKEQTGLDMLLEILGAAI